MSSVIWRQNIDNTDRRRAQLTFLIYLNYNIFTINVIMPERKKILLMHFKDLMTGNKFNDYRVTIVSTHNLQGNIWNFMHFLFLSAQKIVELQRKQSEYYWLKGRCQSGRNAKILYHLCSFLFFFVFLMFGEIRGSISVNKFKFQ